MDIVRLLTVILLILCTAFFVASEYSVIRVRISRIDQLAAAGNRKAAAVQSILSRLDEYLSACQLGNTLTALALGWLGESTIEHLLAPVFGLFHIPESLEALLSFLIAFMLLTFFEVVVGELVPKSFAIQLAEPMAMFFSRPLIIFYKLTYPINWFLSRSSRLITGWFGIKPAGEHETVQTEAELRLALSEGYKSGQINPFEYRYLNNIFELDKLAVQGIMVPRTEIHAIPQHMLLEEFVKQEDSTRYAYYPVTVEGDKDRIIGIVDTREMLGRYIRQEVSGTGRVGQYAKPVIHIIDTIRAQNLLLNMQKEGIKMAVLQDEFGGTTGIVTIEDILESIVGEIDDEPYNPNREENFTELGDGRYLIHPQVPLYEINNRLHAGLESGEAHTLGGWMLARKYDIAAGGALRSRNVLFTVKEMERGRIKWIEARKLTREEQAELKNNEAGAGSPAH
jgi:CBS domain containing-hemolysin-like protein